MADTALQRIKRLDEQRAALLEEARNEALAKAEAAVAELNALGFSYGLVERRGAARQTPPGRKGTRQVDPNKPCPTCGFVTDPPHDARAHRSQGGNKKPFTAAELSEKGLRRVG